ncbi:longitudinals lacking protein, isoforms H/M/V-like [Teleopsis dalmanni]|nr:longitudinals lacking protein, isoforms H/M/V-like [Teleopsis dalmanni]
MDSQDLSASREGSSSPSRRRRKVRRRSIENAMTDIHDNSNSSQMQSNQSALLQQPANLAGAGAITAAAAQIPTSSTALSTGIMLLMVLQEQPQVNDEEMGMDDLDHNAGTSQGGEGSSQGYAPWQHDRSQDELLLTTQDAQQRDPQGKF